MLAAAAGIPRGQQWPTWIREVSLAVRVEDRGVLVSDFHTINPVDVRRYRRLSEPDRSRLTVVKKASGARNDDPIVTRRFYVADAQYLLLVEDPDGKAASVLASPRWTLFAGRKSCPLSEPFVLGAYEGELGEALVSVPSPSGRSRLEAVTFGDSPLVSFRSEVRRDRAEYRGSYAPQRRSFAWVSPPPVGDWFEVISYLSAGAGGYESEE